MDLEQPLSEAVDMWGLGYVLALMMTCCLQFEMADGTYVVRALCLCSGGRRRRRRSVSVAPLDSGLCSVPR